MRLFVAIFPPVEVGRAALDGARRALDETSGSRIRWTPPRNVHLTLKFLGEVAEGAVQGISPALAAVCARHPSFDVRPTGELGAFPSARRAQVVWTSIGAGAGELAELAAGIEASLAPLGYPQEGRAYRAHLTLGRVRGRPASLDLPPSIEAPPGFHAKRVLLVESRLGPNGPSYSEVEDYSLRDHPRSG